MWRFLRRAIFTGDREWAWRRRFCIAGGLVALASFANAAFVDHDPVHSALVIAAARDLYIAILGVYVAGAVADDHLKRTAMPPSPPPEASRP